MTDLRHRFHVSTTKIWLGVAWGVAMLAIGLMVRQWSAAGTATKARDLAKQRVEALELQVQHMKRSLTAMQSDSRPAPKAFVAPATGPAGAEITPQAKQAVVAANLKKKAAIDDALRQQTARRLLDLEMNVRPRFERLGLSGAQWDEYQKLVLESFDALTDGPRAARRGLSDPEAKAVAERTRADIQARMKQLVGADAFRELEEFRSPKPSDPLRGVPDRLANQLMFTDAPLEPEQARQLLAWLEANRSRIPTTGSHVILPDRMLMDLESVLSPPQVTAWKQLQALSQLELRMQELSKQPRLTTKK